MFKIVIVDDDRQMQAIIRDKIKEKTDAFRDAKIQIFSSAEAFLAEAKQEEHGEEGDLFFVDIELGDGITGLEFGRILRKKYPNRGLVHQIIINWLYLDLILHQQPALLLDLFHQAYMSSDKQQAPC